MKLQLFQVDAFTSGPFSGNPAAVCPLEDWPDDSFLQAIALENNLSETAFFVPIETGYHIRWFTPWTEVSLCGHATLATGYVLWEQLGENSESLSFQSLSGPLCVRQREGLIELDFPLLPPQPEEPTAELITALGPEPDEFYLASESDHSGNYMAVYSSRQEIEDLHPNFHYLETLKGFGLIVTAPGEEVDFVSRYFAPSYGIREDPATGSTHCTLTPYWSKRLGKDTLHALQASARGGEFWCRSWKDRVGIAGKAACYLQGWIEVPVSRAVGLFETET